VNDALRDINGIDPVSWWPLAAGWWVLAAILVVLLLLAKWNWPVLVAWYKRPKAAWRRDARRQLMQLRKRLENSDQKQLAAELSELVRRIAVARCGRENCAGLTGKSWLEWLTANDPDSFDWNSHGELLHELTYAPPTQRNYRSQFELMIRAAVGWTEASTCTGKADA
jgi:hypothetical protein